MSSELTKELSETSLLALANKVKDPNDLGDMLSDDKDSENKSLLDGTSSVPIKAKSTYSNSNALTPMQKDQKQFGMFLGPMMDELDKLVQKNMEELDRIEDDSLKQQYERLVEHVPVEIRQCKPIEAIMKSLEELIINTKQEHNNENMIDLSQKKSQEFLQSKIKQDNHNDNDGESKKNTETDSDLKKNSKLNKINNIACLAQSLTAYLITVNSKKNDEQLKNLTVKLYDSVSSWVSRLFRFHNSALLFHDHESDGLIRMCSMYMNYKYKSFQIEGYTAIKKQPIIYISESSKYSNIEYRELVTIQLGLPMSSIKLVKVSKANDCTHDKIDIPELVKQIEEDISADLSPLVLVGNAGSYNIGQCDDINQLNTLCYKYNIWLHLEGVYLSSLILYSVPTEIQPVASGDSITLNLSTWIGVPSLSYITLYKNVSRSSSYIQPFNGFLPTLQKCLPYWCILQAMGHDGVLDQIRRATDCSQNVQNILLKHKPYLNILSFKENRSGKVEKTYSIGELISTALSFLTYVDMVNPIVVFKCDQKHIRERFFLNSVTPKKKEAKKDFFDIGGGYEPLFEYEKEKFAKKVEQIPRDEIDDYTDTLTTWLCDLMNSLHKNIELELIEIENIGVCIRFSPLEHLNVNRTTQKDIDNFSQSLFDIIAILDASIRCKSVFDANIKEYKNLISVNIPKWAGIGAVRYIPDYLLDNLEKINKYQEEMISLSTSSSNGNLKEDISLNEKSNEQEASDKVDDLNKSFYKEEQTKPNRNELLEKYIEEIKSINKALVEKLQAQDGAFSLGEASDGMVAIKCGMVNEMDDLKKLACQVQDVGKDVEESARFIEKMSELIRQGIEKANVDLKKENDQKLMQQGVLRQIPIVGGIFNWLAPTEPVTFCGRSFDLQSGKVASTETTLKYHMQINTDELNSEKEANGISEKNLDSTSKNNADLLNNSENSHPVTRNDRKLSSTSNHSKTSISALNGDETIKN